MPFDKTEIAANENFRDKIDLLFDCLGLSTDGQVHPLARRVSTFPGLVDTQLSSGYEYRGRIDYGRNQEAVYKGVQDPGGPVAELEWQSWASD